MGAALDMFLGKKQPPAQKAEADPPTDRQVQSNEDADDEAIAAMVETVPSLAEAISAFADMTKRLDPLYLLGARWWSGRLVALHAEAGVISVEASTSASRFRREAMTLIGAAAEQLLSGEPSDEYKTAVTDAVNAINRELMALVGAVGAQVRASAEGAVNAQ